MMERTNSTLAFWRLRGKPFENRCNPAMLYESRRHREALERLLYLVRDGDSGFGLLTGEIGCGKTLLLQTLVARLQGGVALTVLIENPCGGFDGLLHEICDGMGRRTTGPTGAAATRYELIRWFRHRFEERVLRLRRQMVLLIDEAQQLDDETLIELKNLSNVCGVRGGAFLVVLAGQPELGEKVRALQPLDQRVAVRYHLMPLEAEAIGAYVDTRMRAAGWSGADSAFSDDAKAALEALTGGIPREINRLCKLALDRACSQNRHQVQEADVACLAEDVFQQSARAF